MPDRPPLAGEVTSKGRSKALQRWLTFFYGVFLLLVSVLPGERLPKIINWNTLFSPDKIAHFGAYAVFAVLLSLSLHASSPARRAATAVLIATVFGIAMEFLQAVAGTGRDFDPVDMVANLIGAVLGGLIYLVLNKYVSKYFASARS